mmetsp:Transcript_28515/g.62766  ORF Transcript_28515/g.62766 Transcript_28515/m.62766 type:complete len:106 (-) Transcript_28515:61-378(-)
MWRTIPLSKDAFASKKDAFASSKLASKYAIHWREATAHPNSPGSSRKRDEGLLVLVQDAEAGHSGTVARSRPVLCNHFGRYFCNRGRNPKYPAGGEDVGSGPSAP